MIGAKQFIEQLTNSETGEPGQLLKLKKDKNFDKIFDACKCRCCDHEE